MCARDFVIGFGFASNWPEKWHEIFFSKRSNRDQVITLESHLKTVQNRLNFNIKCYLLTIIP